MAAANQDIVFVLVPGSFSPASFYDRTVPLLKAKGYDAHPTELKSANHGTGPNISMYEDAQEINNIVNKLADKGKDVILVCNSYGGMPATERSKGTSSAERLAAGKSGGLIGIVYLSAFAARTGECVREIMGARMPEQEISFNGYMSMDPETAVDFIFSHLNPEDRKMYGRRFRNHSARTLSDGSTFPGYLKVPSTYVVCTDDPVIPPELQHEMVRSALAQGAEMVVKEIHSDHCPMVTHPEEVYT